jgi:hypothetical protein
MNQEPLINAISSILNKTPADVDPFKNMEIATDNRISEESMNIKVKRALLQEKRVKRDKSHNLPDSSKIAEDKKYKKIATKGIVKLFNAIKTQQKESVPEKNLFYEFLASDNKSIKENKNHDEKKKKTQGWKVLDDQYMIDGGLKNWDQE